MPCDQTNSTGIGVKCDRCFDGVSSAVASGCRPGLPVSPRRVAELQRIGSTLTLGRSGNSATAASLTTGGECCTGDCRQGRDCPERGRQDAEGDDSFALWVGLRNAIAITAGCAVIALGSCELLARIAS